MAAQSQVPAYVSEFVGTFLLVLTVACNVLAQNSVWAATSIAAVLMVSIYALGSVSGAHFNPAVTLAIALSDKMGEGGWGKAIIYMLVQVLGGTCGAICGFTMYNNSFNLEPVGTFGGKQAAVVEILYTFMLCFVVLNVACSKNNPATKDNQFYGLAIGFVIVAGGYAAGGVSGGAFNPAVALGIDLASVIRHGFGWSLAYIVFEFIGAALAAALYRVVRSEEFGGVLSASGSSMAAKLTSEFLGTYILVVTVGLNVLAGSKGSHPAAVFSIAASLMCMIYALGHVSGAHFNPAVTFAILLSGRNKISVQDAAAYAAAQLAGSLAAGMTYFSVWGATVPLAPAAGWTPAAIGEVIFTAVLCFVVLSVATTKKPSKDFFGLAIGSCVTVGGYAIGSLSGGSLNPAVSFGLDTSHAIITHESWSNCLGYSAFELLGGAIAVGAFYVCNPAEYNKEYDSLVHHP